LTNSAKTGNSRRVVSLENITCCCRCVVDL